MKDIIIADNNEVNATLYKIFLNNHFPNYRVHSVTDGDAASKQIKASGDNLEMVLTELPLSVKTGLEIAKEAKTNNPDVYVGFVTAQPESAVANVDYDFYHQIPIETLKLYFQISKFLKD